jgi:hypothetical protein
MCNQPFFVLLTEVKRLLYQKKMLLVIIASESSKEIKLIVCWDLYNRWKLSPLKKENCVLFKWTPKKN